MFFGLFKRELKPFATDFLPEQDGHQVYYQQFGNPNGEAVLSFHGGPGSKSKASHAANYDLKKFRVILFDQRGCGKSISRNPLYRNESRYLIEDAIRILKTLKIKGKVIVAGGSWGATLALLFAETHLERVKKIILNSVFLADKTALEWMPNTSRLFYPDLIEKFEQESNGKALKKYFASLILSDDKQKQEKALKSYASYERVLGSTKAILPMGPFTEEDLAYPRIFFHYDKNDYFLKQNQIIKDTVKIKNIPTLIVHNRLDMCCPIIGAWTLHKALKKSKLVIVPNRGHGSKLLAETLRAEIKLFLA